MAILAPEMAIMGVFGNTNKSGNLVKTVSQFDSSGSNESKKCPKENFPLYFSGHSFVNAKMDGHGKPKL